MLGIAGPLGAAFAIFAVWYWFSPEYTDVGYRPEQPVAFSHKLHAGEMGMDCRYCHNTVERAAMAAVPPTATCMNCHWQIKNEKGKQSPRIMPLNESMATGDPIPWQRVHLLPDYVYFDHAPHIASGVGCSTCHGRVDGMATVAQEESLSMSWCLDCHVDPGPNLRPLDEVTNMDWETPAYAGRRLAYNYEEDEERTRLPSPPTHCSGCHR